jgi:hypothetical protein
VTSAPGGIVLAQVEVETGVRRGAMLGRMRVPALVLLAACGSQAAPASRGGVIADDDAAVAAFQAAWATDVRPRIADPLVRRIDTRMQSVDALGVYHAEPHACRDGIERVRSLAGGGQTFVFHGTPDALLRDDRCWSVLFLGGMKLDAEGWLDATGHLLIAWRIPEG